ncbi:hypothetical protein Tco_0568150 [Tanacetum coccineum]
MWCYEHHAEITAMVNDTTHVLIQSQELQREDVATLCGWMLLLDRQHLKVILRELLHDQVILRELLHDQVILRDLTESRMAECSDLHPENHTLESAGILHEIYQGMRNLNME